MWPALLMFVRSDWKYIFIFLLGFACSYPLLRWHDNETAKTISDLHAQLATVAADGAMASLKAKTDADAERDTAVKNMQETYSKVFEGLTNINTQLAPVIASMNANFKVLQNDPTFACLYRPLPSAILGSLRLQASSAAASH